MLADIKQLSEKMDEDRKIEAEKWRKHDAKWMELFGPYLKKKPTKETKKPRRETNENRESTNTSFSSFGYINMNNSPTPRMERMEISDMAQGYNYNEN